MVSLFIFSLSGFLLKKWKQEVSISRYFRKKKFENVHLQKSDYLKILVTKNLSPELKQNYVSLDVL